MFCILYTLHANYVKGNTAIKADNSQIFGAVYVT